MSSSLTRGPLPAEVYWRRRVLALGLAAVLTFGIARLLGAGSDGASSPDQARQAVATATSTTSARPTAAPSDRHKEKRRKNPTDKLPSDERTEKTPPPLAVPSGPCVDGDVSVTPQVEDAVAGRSVLIVLELRTVVSEACTWTLSPARLTLKVTSGSDEIWSSRECPSAVPERDVTVRRAVSSTIGIVWDGKRSDPDCSRYTEWALPGYYYAAASSLGGEPAEEQFELETPVAEVITQTLPPKPDRNDESDKSDKNNDGGSDGTRNGAQEPEGEPSGSGNG